MLQATQNFSVRQIAINDDTKKLSLGNEAYAPLKTFLRKNAFDFHQYEIAKTYVLVNQTSKPSRIWGYISLMNSEIVLNEGQRPQQPSATAKYQTFPAIKLARLAIDKQLQGQGFGTKFLDWCVNHIELSVMPHVGCRFLVVDSKRKSVPFYQRLGFTLLNTHSNHEDEHPLMFLDLLKEKETSPQTTLIKVSTHKRQQVINELESN